MVLGQVWGCVQERVPANLLTCVGNMISLHDLSPSKGIVVNNWEIFSEPESLLCVGRNTVWFSYLIWCLVNLSEILVCTSIESSLFSSSSEEVAIRFYIASFVIGIIASFWQLLEFVKLVLLTLTSNSKALGQSYLKHQG